jgi:hypothetical protein
MESSCKKYCLHEDCWYIIVSFLELKYYSSVLILSKTIFQKVKNMVDPRSKNNLAIRYFCGKGNVHQVQKLLNDPRVDPSDQNNDALHRACVGGYTMIVQLLLSDKRVVPECLENHALHIAVSCNHPSIVCILTATCKVKKSEQFRLVLLSIGLSDQTILKHLLVQYGMVTGLYQHACMATINEDKLKMFQVICDWTFEKIATAQGITYNRLLWLLNELVIKNKTKFIDHVIQNHIHQLDKDCAYYMFQHSVKTGEEKLARRLLELYGDQLGAYIDQDRQALLYYCYKGLLFDIAKCVLGYDGIDI